MPRPSRHLTLPLVLLLALRSAAARADVVVIAGAASPLELRDAAEVARIFLGKSEVTAGGALVVALDQPEGAPARTEFYRQFTGKTPAQVRAYWARLIFTGKGQPPRQLDAASTAKALAANPRAIAYVDRAAVPSGTRIVFPAPTP